MKKGQFKDVSKLEVVYENYARAMAKRRPESVLEQDRFTAYCFREDTFYVSLGNSVVIGQMNNEVFCPSHFAPAGLKESIDLIKELRKDNVIFAVTPDLGAMLKKLGYKFIFTTKACFRGEEVEKEIFASSYKTVAIYFVNKLREDISLRVNKLFKKISFKMRRAISSIAVHFEREIKEEINEAEIYEDYASIYGPQD